MERVSELGVEGIWECRPDCDTQLTYEERVLAAIELDTDEEI